MSELHSAIAAILLASVLVGLIRVARGPTLPDRMLVAQLFGTTGVTVLLVLGADPDRAALRDVALVFAVLAAIAVVAFVQLVPLRSERDR